MKKLILASLATVAFASGPALAADLPAPVSPAPVYKAPPPPPPTWTGCYVNGGGGYGLWNSDHNLETFPGLAPLDVTTTSGGRGWFGAAGGGCDLQFPLLGWNVVVGAFGDYDFMDLNGTVSDPFSGLQGQLTEQGAWAGGGRVGVLVTPTLLTYFNGGYTGAHIGQVNYATATGGVSPFYASSHNVSGYFLGGGTEYALTWDWLPIRGLFWRNEYRWSSYSATDDQSFNATTGLGTAFANHSQLTTQTIASELVWRFNWTPAR
jgi:outer membrane immunogenic protein